MYYREMVHIHMADKKSFRKPKAINVGKPIAYLQVAKYIIAATR
jgi:hypothetical protein